MSGRSTFLLLALLLPILGCDSMSNSPSAPSMRLTTTASEAGSPGNASIGRYPLVLGASWTYEGTEWTRERLSGQADFGIATRREFTRVASAIRHTSYVPGAEHLAIRSVTTFEGAHPGPFESFQHLRQDHAGLYSYPATGGLSSLAVAHTIAPDPLQYEIVLLVYPVHVGSVWSAAPTYPGSESRGSTFTIEAIEPIRTPRGVEPAARVRARSESMLSGRQPDLTWFGRSGVLRTWKRTNSPFTTPLSEHGERERTTEERLVAVTGI